MVVMSNRALKESLAEKIRSTGSTVESAESTDGLLGAVQRDHPSVVVLDPAVCLFGAPLTVGILKEVQPDLRIIVHTEAPSESDAEVVERGIFYYAGNCDLDTLFGVVPRRNAAGARRRSLLTHAGLRACWESPRWRSSWGFYRPGRARPRS